MIGEKSAADLAWEAEKDFSDEIGKTILIHYRIACEGYPTSEALYASIQEWEQVNGNFLTTVKEDFQL